MDIDYKVPFFANTPDDTHCFQAVLKSILKYFAPEKDYSWKELDKITAKAPGMWTWPMAGLIWLKKNGFEVHYIEEFDYRRFAQIGQKYLEEIYGKDIAAIQVKNSKLPQEIEYAKDFTKKIDMKIRPAKLNEVLNYLKRGYLVVANVNSSVLNGEDGYIGHFVTVKGVKGQNLIIHDPGSPAHESRMVSFEEFDKAWAYPMPKERNLVAIKKL